MYKVSFLGVQLDGIAQLFSDCFSLLVVRQIKPWINIRVRITSYNFKSSSNTKCYDMYYMVIYDHNYDITCYDI